MLKPFLVVVYALPVLTILATFATLNRPKVYRPMAVASSLISLWVVTLLGFYQPEQAVNVWNAPWIERIGARIILGLEPMGYLMLWVTAFSTVLAVLAAIRDTAPEKSLGLMLVLLFVVQAVLNVLFTARDLLLFFICYETILIPMYLLILIWGGKNRVYASLKFLLFTFLGSLPMLFAVVAIGIYTGWALDGNPTFALETLRTLQYTRVQVNVSFFVAQFSLAPLLFAGLTFAFLVKIPLWPFHTWLPDAHTEAPTAGSIVLAGILLKMGTYGLAVWAIPLFPEIARQASAFLQILALFGIILGAFASWAQSDAKRLIAYSSVSHMGFVVLGLFTFTEEGYLGALMQMAAHGVATGVLFYFIGALYRRRHDRELGSYGGLARLSPRMSVWASVACFASTALPGTAGFAAEIMVLYGTLVTRPVFAVLAAPAVIFSAAYILKFMKGIVFNDADPEFSKCWDGEKRDELAVLIACGAILVIVGIAPQATVYAWLAPSVRFLLGAIF